ncbi:hypothetical protein [Comamonas kerstersii]|uniref:hypothetical protein n=1 Tax=Comamonas kerstersii TaxID=225992 RepID=UPI0013EF4BE0|nr:hypothetical protein [Comamonas kerstersii]
METTLVLMVMAMANAPNTVMLESLRLLSGAVFHLLSMALLLQGPARPLCMFFRRPCAELENKKRTVTNKKRPSPGEPGHQSKLSKNLLRLRSAASRT